MKAVILAGGGGTRLWPLSTHDVPKQFQKLISSKTMIEETIDRLDFLDPKDIYLAINAKHLQLVKELCPQVPHENIIIEPALRDTAPCIALASSIIEKRHPGEVMAIIYADHHIQNKEAFQDKIKIAAEVAKEDKIAIVEVVATEPNTNYGYVKLGAKISDNEVYKLDSFVEKPDIETATKFIMEGNYLWNTGIYVWKSSVILNHFKKLKPAIFDAMEAISKDYDGPNQEETLAQIYPEIEKISLDYAVMEHIDTEDVRIIKAELGWSDIGTWEALWEKQANAETAENISKGEVSIVDCQGCLIYGHEDKKIAAIGLNDLIIVDTEHGLLVCQKNHSKKIKNIF